MATCVPHFCGDVFISTKSIEKRTAMQKVTKENPNSPDLKNQRQHIVDPEATSSETLADLEQNEKTTDEGETNRSPSPDGTFEDDSSKRSDRSDSGAPM
jgi:hypothetical protein